MIKWELVWGKEFPCVEYKMCYIQYALGHTGLELRSEVLALFRDPVYVCF